MCLFPCAKLLSVWIKLFFLFQRLRHGLWQELQKDHLITVVNVDGSSKEVSITDFVDELVTYSYAAISGSQRKLYSLQNGSVLRRPVQRNIRNLYSLLDEEMDEMLPSHLRDYMYFVQSSLGVFSSLLGIQTVIDPPNNQTLPSIQGLARLNMLSSKGGRHITINKSRGPSLFVFPGSIFLT